METEVSVQPLDAFCSLVGQRNWTSMARQPVCKSDLVIPTKVLFGVLRKFNVIGRICVDEIVRLQRETIEIAARELPTSKG